MAKLGHEVEYLLAQGLAGVVRRMSAYRADRFAATLGGLIYRVWGRRREIALTNLRKALGNELSEALIQHTAQIVFENMARSLVETARFPRIGPEGIRELVVPYDMTAVEEARRRGNGALICTAHYGNWELLGAFAAYGYPMDLLVGIQHNPRMHKLINECRRSVGVGVIDAGVAARGVLRSLRANHLVGIAADQHSHTGLPITFFGRRAIASRGPAVFSVKTGAPIIPCLMVRERYDRHVMTFGETIYPPGGSGDDKDVDDMTIALHRFYEAGIRRHPEQWMWTHRRWKAAKD